MQLFNTILAPQKSSINSQTMIAVNNVPKDCIILRAWKLIMKQHFIIILNGLTCNFLVEKSEGWACKNFETTDLSAFFEWLSPDSTPNQSEKLGQNEEPTLCRRAFICCSSVSQIKQQCIQLSYFYNLIF